MIVSLDEAKEHLRVDGDDEDGLIQIYMDAAEERIKNYLDRDIPENPAVKLAALMLIAGYYDLREDQVVGGTVEENPAVKRLLFPLRDKMGV